MGHWAEENLPELKRQLGITGPEHDEELRSYARAAQDQIERLAGRRFGRVRHGTFHIKSNGLPFVEVDDLNVDGQPVGSDTPTWPVPDPIHPQYARILQVNTPLRVAPRAEPLPAAIRVAARLIVPGVTEEVFTSAVWWWLKGERDEGRLEEVFRWAMEPDTHVHVPIVATNVDGWWVQISRRLLLVTMETPDDGPLVEVLLHTPGQPALVATEPLITIARLTEHPVTWAMPIRVWITAGKQRSLTWSVRSGPEAIHRYGLPVVSLDGESTVEEATAQLLLSAHWHGYLAGDGHEIPPALASAFPHEVGRIRRGTGDPDDLSAATRLFGRLYRKGFDPSCSAETMRHYVRRHARTIVQAHHSAQRTDQPWRQLGISESYYYKLLRKRGVPKGPDGRFIVDETTFEEIRGELEDRAAERDRRQAAIELLTLRGYGEANARKRVQRYGPEGAIADSPRGRPAARIGR